MINDDKWWSIVDWQWSTIGDWWGFRWLQHTTAETGQAGGRSWLDCKILFKHLITADQRWLLMIITDNCWVSQGQILEPSTAHWLTLDFLQRMDLLLEMSDVRYRRWISCQRCQMSDVRDGFPVREPEIYSFAGRRYPVQFLLQHDDPLQCCFTASYLL